MKTLREMINLIESAEQPVAEGHADQQRKIFKKNGRPVGEVGIDRESSPGVGQWYMKCYVNGIDNSGYDSYEEAVEELKHCLKQGVAEGEKEKNPFEKGSMGHALWRDLSRTKKASPAQQQRNRERFAQRDAEKAKQQGVAEEQVEESTPDALAKIDQLFRK